MAGKGNTANLTNAGKGRVKGVPNKVTTLAKRAIAEAFDELGGKAALVEWAKLNDDNMKVFYATIWPKIIPLQVEADGTIDHNHTHRAAGVSDALEWISGALRAEEPTAH